MAGKLVHPLNEYMPTVLKPSGNRTFVNRVQSSNAPVLRVTTFAPSMVAGMFSSVKEVSFKPSILTESPKI